VSFAPTASAPDGGGGGGVDWIRIN